MRKRIIVPVVLASSLFSVTNAVDLKLFGSIGALGNVGFGSSNTTAGSAASGYVGLTGHIGLDVNMSGFKVGVGAMAGFAPLTFGSGGTYLNNAFVGSYGKLYGKPWIELSDLYVGYDNDSFKIYLGRYNASKILYTSDWIGGYNQGLALMYKSSIFNIWATYVNEVLWNGFNASGSVGSESRYGMDLAGFGRFSSDWNNFNFNNELLAGGADIKIGNVARISPYAQYWLRKYNSDLLQVGITAELKFDAGFMRSTTLGRFLWSNLTATNTNGFMWQVDQEFLLFNIFKLGGGYLSIGNVALSGNSLIDRTRFYGQYLYPYAYSGTGLYNRAYLNAHVDTWYVFTGAKIGDSLNLDILYAGGDYREFSAVVSYTIIGGGENQTSGIKWSVGGGYVTDNFKHASSGIAFTKLSF